MFRRNPSEDSVSEIGIGRIGSARTRMLKMKKERKKERKKELEDAIGFGKRERRAVRAGRMITSQEGEATCGECDCRLVPWEGRWVIWPATVHMEAYDGKLRLSSDVPTPVTASNILFRKFYDACSATTNT
ncbi:hypothetical protein VNO78_02582 [Psophocarpus tetragonolobus]|uniref:Uncharacterized protein n=1 Tax=Psophocarpus tetragonolobus TaxID=3891 RepID=A0AAN9XUT8_PSOTE